MTKTIPSDLNRKRIESSDEIIDLEGGENLLSLAVFAHLNALQSQLAANFFFEIAPPKHVLEVAFASKPVEANVAIYRLSEVFCGKVERKVREDTLSDVKRSSEQTLSV